MRKIKAFLDQSTAGLDVLSTNVLGRDDPLQTIFLAAFWFMVGFVVSKVAGKMGFSDQWAFSLGVMVAITTMITMCYRAGKRE